jgi:hypothetical protein
MQYIIRDIISDFFLAVDPRPGVPFLLREDPVHASTFSSRREALETLKAAQLTLASRYKDLELEVQLHGRNGTRAAPSIERSRGDVADSYNEVLAHNRKYDRDMR